VDEDPAFYWQYLDYVNVADVARVMAETLSPLHNDDDDGGLYGIVSEEDGGIIAYAIGKPHAQQIVAALRATEGVPA
jgi:hypothetical protein